jgi:chromosome segregation ATPase
VRGELTVPVGKATKDGLTLVAGALRKAIQDLPAPELKNHTELLRDHAQALTAIVSELHEHSRILHEHTQILHEHSQIMRNQGERLARIEGELTGVRNELSGLRTNVVEVKSELSDRLIRLEDKLDVRERLAAGVLPFWKAADKTRVRAARVNSVAAGAAGACAQPAVDHQCVAGHE